MQGVALGVILIVAVFVLLIHVVFIRWIFRIDHNIKRQDKIIDLLTRINNNILDTK